MPAISNDEQKASGALEVAKAFFRHESATLIVILVGIITALAIMTKGMVITPRNLMNVLLQSSVRGVASIGQTFVILTAGIDVSIGGLALMCAVLGASLMSDSFANILGSPVAVYVAIPIMLLVGLGVGAANGMSVSRLRMPALIVTLAMWQMTRGGAYLVCKGATIMSLPRSLAAIGQGYVGPVPVPVIIFVAVAVISYFVLHHTTFGRSVYAVGGNAASAWLSGINVKAILFSVYGISGFLAALAAVIQISRTMSASMLSLTGLEIDTIAAVCVGGVSLAGGRGTLIGAVIGVMIIGVINNGMNVMGLDPSYQDLVKGAIIFTAVAVDVVRRTR
ncbi:MAG: ABC transporter permease [Dehalococcoidia bacterium]|nr:ABC transporter permease [Dehalococcoidia bacterium]